MADHVRISKTLSYWLRHRPDEALATLTADGWAETDAVLAALSKQNLPSDFATLLAVVEDNDKQRFELSPDLARIRARQGHSVAVDLALAPHAPPAFLFHGTIGRFLPSILVEGLNKMQRQHVHLSGTIQVARSVGARRGDPVLLAIWASQMQRDGYTFFLSSNGVWLSDHVPAKYLRKVEQHDGIEALFR